MVTVNGCPSVSRSGHRCDKKDGHRGLHEYNERFPEGGIEWWDDATAKMRMTLIVTTTESHEVDVERLGPMYDPTEPNALGVMLFAEDPDTRNEAIGWILDFFAKHDGSVFGDETFGSLDFDCGMEIIEKSWHD